MSTPNLVPLQRWDALHSGLVRRGRTALSAPTAPPVVPFTLNVDKPGANNVGAGIIRPYPTKVINGNYTLTEANGPLLDTIVNGKLTIIGDDSIAYAENCVINGGIAPTGSAFVVNTTGSTTTSTYDNPRYNLRFCDIAPQNPSVYWNAVGSRNIRMWRCDVWHAVDLVRLYTNTADGLVKSWIRGSWLHDVSQFSPDTATNNRAITHNDVAQLDGNPGGNEFDQVWEGNLLQARPSKLVGTQPTQYTELAVFMLSIDVATEINMYAFHNWMEGGVHMVNAGKAGGTGRLVFKENIVEKAVSGSTTGPQVNFNIGSGYTKVLTGNVYPDGTPVPNAF